MLKQMISVKAGTTRLVFMGLVKRGEKDIGAFYCSGDHRGNKAKRLYVDVCSVSRYCTWGCEECMRFHEPVPGMQNTSKLLDLQFKFMHKRCYDPRDDSFDDYGARGIGVADEWHDFEVYSNHVRVMPYFGMMGYSLDRIDNNKGYAPGNVRWAPEWWQQFNKRANQDNMMYQPYKGEILPAEFRS